MKAIIDTNVFVSGTFWNGPPSRILLAWEAHKINLVISRDIYAEYERVGNILLTRYKSTKFEPFLGLVSMRCELIDVPKLEFPVSRDPDDDKFIACALTTGTHVIISGDRDLLDISGFSGIDVFSPAAFVKRYLD